MQTPSKVYLATLVNPDAEQPTSSGRAVSGVADAGRPAAKTPSHQPLVHCTPRLWRRGESPAPTRRSIAPLYSKARAGYHRPVARSCVHRTGTGVILSAVEPERWRGRPPLLGRSHTRATMPLTCLGRSHTRATMPQPRLRHPHPKRASGLRLERLRAVPMRPPPGRKLPPLLRRRPPRLL